MKRIVTVLLIVGLVVPLLAQKLSVEEKAALEEALSAPLEFRVADSAEAWGRVFDFMTQWPFVDNAKASPGLMESDDLFVYIPGYLYRVEAKFSGTLTVNCVPGSEVRFTIRSTEGWNKQAHLLAHYLQTGKLNPKFLK